MLLQSGGLSMGLSCPGEAGIGYDFELSVRMWAEGHKVGLAGCCALMTRRCMDSDLVCFSHLRCLYIPHQVGLMDAGFDRLGHSTAGSSKEVVTRLTSGTRKNKAKHKARIANYHVNNEALYHMFPGFHHRQGTLLALKASRALPRAQSQGRDILE